MPQRTKPGASTPWDRGSAPGTVAGEAGEQLGEAPADHLGRVEHPFADPYRFLPRPYLASPCAAIALSCGHTDPLW